MKVLVTGATGLVGSALVPRLEASGHEVRTVSHSGRGDHDWSDASLEEAVSWCDGIVHLAGENIMAKRWSVRQKLRLTESRVGPTTKLARLAARHEIDVFVSASAVGWYGPREATELDESAPHGKDFLALLCVGWEDANRRARIAGVRCAIVRVGIVMSNEGGALKKMLLPFKLGLGGRLGSGKQGFSWVHRDDLVALFQFVLEDERAEGVFNGTAPGPVSNKDFTRALGRVLGRPTLFPVPAPALYVAVGGVAQVLLTGQFVVPRHAQELGFSFQHPEIEGALRNLLK